MTTAYERAVAGSQRRSSTPDAEPFDLYGAPLVLRKHHAVVPSSPLTTGDLTHIVNDNGGPPLIDPVPATAFEVVEKEINDLYDEAKNFCDGQPIDSQAMHDAVEQLHTAIHEAGKRAEALRVEEKKPFDEQVKAIQAKYNPLIQDKRGRVSLAKDSLGALLGPWRVKVAEEKAAAARRAREEAEALAAQATAEMQASSGNLEAREAAEEIVATAKDATRYAKKQERAASTGNGLRSVWSAELVDLPGALDWAYTKHQPAFEELVCSLAATEVGNGTRIIPGFQITERRVATV